MNRTYWIYLSIACVLLIGTAVSRATLIAYEGFSTNSYNAGALLNQNPSAIGFTNAWNTGGNVYASGTNAALTYTGLGSEDSGGAYSASLGNRAVRDFAAALSGTNTYYLSILMKNTAISADVNNYRALELRSFGNRNLQIGVNRDIDGTGEKWGMRAIDSPALRATSTVTAVANEIVLAVAKITFSTDNNGDSVRLWINPIDLDIEANSTNYIELTGFNFVNNSINNLSLGAYSGSSTGYWDEIRVATSWADAVPPPAVPTFTVTYVGTGSTGGSVPFDPTHYEEAETVTVRGNTNSLTRINHTFNGWNTAAAGTGTAYVASDTILMGTHTITLYAQWTKIPPGPGEYEVFYDGNGHTVGSPPEDLYYYEQNDAVTVLGNGGTMFRPGYALNSWNTAANGSGTTFAPSSTLTMGTAQVTLYAQWDLSPATGQHVRVFVLAGQSNARGTGSTVSQAPAEWRPLTGVLFDETTPGEPASISSEWEEIGTAVDHMGPEMGFGAVLRNAYSNERIAIVKVAEAGTGLNFWRIPGSSGHDTLMARIGVARSRLDDAVNNNDIPSWSFGGFLWMQGENEANGTLPVAQAYSNDFADLVGKVRTEIGITNLPVVLGRISIKLDPNTGGPVEQPQLDTVRLGQEDWTEIDGRGAWVDTDDLMLVDSWHFGSQSQVILGQRMADAWFTLAEERPRLSLRRSPSQGKRSSQAKVFYDAQFSVPVTGFAADDVTMIGDTGADAVAVTEVDPNDGTTYRIAIGGMDASGVVDLRVFGGAAVDASARPSLCGINEDTLVLFTPHDSAANLLFYDPLTSLSGALHGLQSSFNGAAQGWEVQNSITLGYLTTANDPLHYANLAMSPGHATGGYNYNTCAQGFDLEYGFADYMTSVGSGAIDKPGTTLWFSYLIRVHDLGQRHRVALLRGTQATYADANNAVAVTLSNGTWRMVAQTTNVVDTGVTGVTNQTYLMVLRTHIGGPAANSSAHLWVNPAYGTLGKTDLAIGTAQAAFNTTNAEFKFSRVHWYPGSAAGHGRLDELRMGTTYASVTPITNTVPVDLGVGIAASTNYAVAGETVTYTIYITNLSADISGYYSISNNFGPAFKFAGGSDGASITGNVAVWIMNALAGGASTTLVMNVSPANNDSTQEVTTVVSTVISHANGDTDNSNNSASDGTVTVVGIPINATWALLLIAAVIAWTFYRRAATASC